MTLCSTAGWRASPPAAANGRSMRRPTATCRMTMFGALIATDGALRLGTGAAESAAILDRESNAGATSDDSLHQILSSTPENSVHDCKD